MTDTADTTPEEWWDRSLTSTGRRGILQAAGVRLPSSVLWRHMSAEARAAVEAMRPKEQPQVPAPLSPEETITQLRVENALLRGCLKLAELALADYRDSRHTPTEDTKEFQLTVPAALPGRADDALTRARRMLQQPEQTRAV